MAPKKTKPSVPPPPPAKLPPPPPSTDSDDDGDSSDEEEAIPLQTPVPPQPTTTDSEEESNPEEEESDDDKEEEPTTTTTTTKLPESDSEEEESDDDDDEEEPTTTTTTTKQVVVAAKPQTTLDESDSDEEEESDDDEQPPTTKQAAAVVSETSKKRNLKEDNTTTTNSLGKKLKLSSPSTPTNTAMTNDKKEVDEGPSATPKKTIERLFTKQDEITLLEGILNYNKDVMNDIDDFYDYIHDSLQYDANQNQLKDKIIRMKKKYLNSIKKRANKGPGAAEPTFSQPHDHKSYQLSKRIWHASSTPPPKQIPPSSAVDFGIVGADNDLLKSWVKLGVQGRDDLEEKWKALQIKHLTLHVEKTKLSLETAQLALEAAESHDS